MLDYATSEIASGSKPGLDATKKLRGEGFKRPWPPLVRMDAAVRAKVEKLFRGCQAATAGVISDQHEPARAHHR